MKQIPLVFLLIGLAMGGGLSHAATGYVSDSSASIVRTGYGDCLHTTRWSIPRRMAGLRVHRRRAASGSMPA